MILYINSCVREESRTNRIAKALLERLGGKDVVELPLKELRPAPLSEETLGLRTALIEQRNYDHPMFDYAKQFAAADEIVISAPFWDYSFPALLKEYLENIYVTGIVSRYGEDGRPQGLCRAKTLYYVTTAGGPYVPTFSYDYLGALATQCFGIEKTVLIKAEMLDVIGFDAEEIVQRTIEAIGESIKG